MKDSEKPVYAVMVESYTQFSKWLKTADNKDFVIYRPVFSFNSSVGIYFNAMIITPEFWKVKDAEQIYRHVSTRLRERKRPDASDETLKKRPNRFLEKMVNFLWGKN